MGSHPIQPAPRGGFFHSAAISFGVVAVLALAVWLVFSPALPGIIQFDDLGNLSKLDTVTGLDASAWRWLQQGIAGPLGRPIALATFALQFYQWPEPYALLLWNIALHIINALLVLWLALLLAQRLGATGKDPLAIAFLTALCWAVLPLLNTSALFIIQRMTVLCSTFMLAGLITYLKLRGPADAPRQRQLLALVLLAVFGALATLTKENGVLIVVYGLVIELCVLMGSPHRQRRASPVAIALALACMLLLARLLPMLAWSPGTELQRGFTVTERLASQGVLLLVYLKGLFLPMSSELNPFRVFGVSHDAFHTLWGVGLWVVLMSSPLLAWWRGWRWLALALAWFFYGHIAESGWIPLEIYFAHRNYLPAVSLVFALAYVVWTKKQDALVWRGIFAIYIALLGGLTWMNTSLWGQRELAGEIWLKEQPQSIRAAMNLAYELGRTQGLGAAQFHLERFVNEQRNSSGLRLVSMRYVCQLNPTFNQTEQVRLAVDAIRTLPFEGWGTDVIERLMGPVRNGQCPGLTEQQVGELAAAYLSQPVYQQQPAIASNLLAILGLVAFDEGDMDTAMHFYLQSIEHSASYAMTNMYFHLAQERGDHAGLQRLHAAVMKAPLPRSTTRAEWNALLERIDTTVKTLPPPGESAAQTESGSQ